MICPRSATFNGPPDGRGARADRIEKTCPYTRWYVSWPRGAPRVSNGGIAPSGSPNRVLGLPHFAVIHYVSCIVPSLNNRGSVPPSPLGEAPGQPVPERQRQPCSTASASSSVSTMEPPLASMQPSTKRLTPFDSPRLPRRSVSRPTTPFLAGFDCICP